MPDQIVSAGVTDTPLARGRNALSRWAAVGVPAPQVERGCPRRGAQRVAARDAAVAASRAVPRAQRPAAPPGVPAPAPAVVGGEGGRWPIRGCTGAAGAAAAAPATAGGRRGNRWREDTLGRSQALTRAVAACAPCPEIPASWVGPTRMRQPARAGQRPVLPRAGAVPATRAPAVAAATLAANRRVDEPPAVPGQRGVAARGRGPDGGLLRARAAWAWGSWGANRRASRGAGADNTGAIGRHHVSSCTPLPDCIHAPS